MNTTHILNFSIKKASREDHYVEGVVYAPNQVDSHGAAMAAEQVREMAHKFISSGKHKNIDINHDEKPSGAVVVESYIAKKNDPDGYPEGAWVLGTSIPEGEIWNSIQDGTINGYSVHFMANSVSLIVTTELESVRVGETLENMQGEVHKHMYFLEINNRGEIVEGGTDEVNGHYHIITGFTRTEEANGHSHRYNG